MTRPRSSWLVFSFLLMATLALVVALMVAEGVVTARLAPDPAAPHSALTLSGPPG